MVLANEGRKVHRPQFASQYLVTHDAHCSGLARRDVQMGLADWPLVIGHRGAAGLAPENTLPSFQLAYEMGVSGIELDVHLVAEHLATIHDDTLERTTNGRGKVANLDLDSLRKLDAGGGYGIPLLEEVIAELPEGIGANIELKGRETAEPTAKFLTAFPELDVLVSSFDHRELAVFHQLKPEIIS